MSGVSDKAEPLVPSAVAAIILERLDQGQRDLILAMHPHNDDQRLTKRQFEDIDACVELEPDGWPDVYWFGGMRATFGPGSHKYRYAFRFNEVGLEVREALTAQTNTDAP